MNLKLKSLTVVLLTGVQMNNTTRSSVCLCFSRIWKLDSRSHHTSDCDFAFVVENEWSFLDPPSMMISMCVCTQRHLAAHFYIQYKLMPYFQSSREGYIWDSVLGLTGQGPPSPPITESLLRPLMETIYPENRFLFTPPTLLEQREVYHSMIKNNPIHILLNIR